MKVYEKTHRAMPYMDSDGSDITYWRIVSVNGVLYPPNNPPHTKSQIPEPKNSGIYCNRQLRFVS